MLGQRAAQRAILVVASLSCGLSPGCGGDAASPAPQLGVAEGQAEPARMGASSQSPPALLPEEQTGGAGAEQDCNWLLPPANTLQGSALNILDAYCGACHGRTAETPSAIGPADVLDIERMIDEGYLVDCSADSSEIVRVMRTNEMPPPEYLGIGVTAPDLAQVTRYIEFMCSDEEKACALAPTAPGCVPVLAAREDRRCRR